MEYHCKVVHDQASVRQCAIPISPSVPPAINSVLPPVSSHHSCPLFPPPSCFQVNTLILLV